jgi:hypothetical protein
LSSVFSNGTLRLLGNPHFMDGLRVLSKSDPRDQFATLIQIIPPQGLTNFSIIFAPAYILRPLSRQ